MSKTIGEISKESGIGVETIRFYEREGLIPKPPRRSSGYRSFPVETVRRLRFIRRAREHGFTLGEIRQLLELRVKTGDSLDDMKGMVQDKLDNVRSRIDELNRLVSVLEELAAAVKKKQPTNDCPILEAFDGLD
ncbi:MAG: MerR family transcriptional regulator [Myxococcales bacterium]|nr:MerR family transcriptional regulator [Myxococcales bacterium]MCB9736568.1 MerR family transcriptional regulator [Deltaproteobacteria bacterium]